MINGHELMKQLKLKPGPRVGQLLEAIQEAQAAGKVKNREDALKFAQKLKKEEAANALEI